MSLYYYAGIIEINQIIQLHVNTFYPNITYNLKIIIFILPFAYKSFDYFISSSLI